MLYAECVTVLWAVHVEMESKYPPSSSVGDATSPSGQKLLSNSHSFVVVLPTVQSSWLEQPQNICFQVQMEIPNSFEKMS